MKRTLFERLGSPIGLVCVAMFTIAALMILPACSADDIAVAKQAIPQVQAEVDKTQVALDEAQAQIAVAKAAGEDTTQAEKVVTAMQEALAKADITLDTLHKVLATSTSTADLIEHGSQASASWLGQYGPLVALTGTTIAALIRSHQNREAGRNIAYAIEQAKEAGKVDFDSPAVVAKISANMGARAKRIVDEAQGDVTPILL